MTISIRLRQAAVLAAILSAPLSALRAEEPATETPGRVEETAAAAASDPFPVPEEILGNVAFWKRVFAEWSLGQVALHDLERPELVYAVLDLPGPIGDAYNPRQREFVRAERTRLEARLLEIERRVALGAELDDEDKALALRIATTAGTDALRGAHARVRSQRGLRERFRRGLEIGARYDARFREAFRQAGLPEDLALLPHVESSFQTHARSSAGAVGVWQFTRAAARRFMTLTPAIDERLDPVAAARGAARYLGAAWSEFGSWGLALTSYNHGLEGMRRAKAKFGTDFGRIVREYDGRTFGFASRNFYAEFLAAREIAREPARHFGEGLAFEAPLAHDETVLGRRMRPVQIAREWGVPLGELAEINPAWTRRAVRGGEALPAGTLVWLPEGTLARRAASLRRDERRPAAGLPGPAASEGASRGKPEGEDAIARAVVHVVRSGDTLFRIARRYGVTLAELLGLNRLSADAILRPGQRLFIPLSD